MFMLKPLASSLSTKFFLQLMEFSLTLHMLKKPEDKKQLGDFFGMSNSYAECYPAT